MYFRTIKILAISLKWHRLLALCGIKSFPASISSAVQRDADPNWDIVLPHYSRICRDSRQKPQVWQKFRVNTGLPTTRHTTQQTRGDKSLRASRKHGGGNRDAGMPVKAMTGREKGILRDVWALLVVIRKRPPDAGNHWDRPSERVREATRKTEKKTQRWGYTSRKPRKSVNFAHGEV